jgi:hypothetical protein
MGTELRLAFINFESLPKALIDPNGVWPTEKHGVALKTWHNEMATRIAEMLS